MARFLVLGSASPSLVRGVSESPAGRVGLVDLSGFDLSETGLGSWRSLGKQRLAEMCATLAAHHRL